MALFGEKYSEKVRTVKVGNFSYELCGGTHIGNTSQIAVFLITNESGVASGIRRIEAITGEKAINQLLNNNKIVNKISALVGEPIKEISKRVEFVLNHRKTLKKTIDKLRKKLIGYSIDEFLKPPIKVNEHDLYLNIIEVNSTDELKNIGDKVREKLKHSVAIFGTILDSSPVVICVVTDDLVKNGINAGKIVGKIGKKLGGGGGGRAHMAIAGGSKPEKLESVINELINDEDIKKIV